MAKKKRSRKHQSLAAIEYHGIPGITRECMEAVMRLIQFNDQIDKADILTWSNKHCLLLSINNGDIIAIKSGFTSGYGGEGPKGFSYTLQLLRAHGAEIDEYQIRRDMMYRVDSSCLTNLDLEWVEHANPIRPPRWYDYIQEKDWDSEDEGKIWRNFPYIIPLAIVDYRIVDLAMSFWQSPDEKLLIGYRRLEDIIRNRTKSEEHGAKLFSKVFLGSEAKLGWKGLNSTEQVGRAGLFTSAYQAFRNPRAHKEIQHDSYEVLNEFLILNYLYHLEKESSETEKTE